MNFEKQMKKRIDSKLDSMVPDPYPERKVFPLWAKISIPVGGVALASAIALGVIIPNLNPQNPLTPGPLVGNDYLVTAEKATSIQDLDKTLVGRVSKKTLESLDGFFADSDNKNYVLSPASYLLSATSLLAVSDGFDLDSFGVENAENDSKSLLESWNFLYELNDEYEKAYCQFDSGVLHQQVGPTYQFDEEAQKRIAGDHIATSLASLDNYHDQATEYFHDVVGLNIPIPDPDLSGDGVITYGAIKMKDFVPNGLGQTNKTFYLDDGSIETPSYVFGDVNWPATLPYYQGDGYEAFRFDIAATQMLIVLPNEGVSLESLSVSEAYSSFMDNRHFAKLMGYVPYFHLTTESADITEAFSSHLTGQEKYYSKLLSSSVKNNLSLDSVLQSSDFEFNKDGVAGESITVMTMSGSAGPEAGSVIEINVDRPFYAISLKDDFPLFVNKVNNPSK
ncbi:MAG: hypothetical protein K5694_03785 [Bacilli bacterium]|nr:hypothetical protein [Bacilli bacterium]